MAPSSPRVKRGAVPTIERLAQEVRVVNNYVPRATCLTQALAGQTLPTHYGYRTVVHVGVTKEGGEGTFQAHAWLETDDMVVIGESEVANVPLTTGAVKSRSKCRFQRVAYEFWSLSNIICIILYN
ncbi:MAG: lasso peptide biosynthesis B2 protein [Halobacteriota archaeon]